MQNKDFKVNKDNVKATLIHYLREEVKKTDEELAIEVSMNCGVDLNIWKIKSQRITGNVWTVNGKFKGEKVTYWDEATNSQLKIIIDYERIAPDNYVKFKDELLDIITNVPKKPVKILTPTNGRLLLADNADMHIGRYSYGAETGDSYDVNIAIKRDDQSTAYFIDEIKHRSKKHKYEEILMVFGNDYFNYTYAKPFPHTSNGTPQESDSRYQKMFLTGFYQACKKIEMYSTIAPVRIIFVAGSHDEENTFYLSVAINAYFRNNPNVKVVVSPKLREFYKFGKNLLGFDHGQYPTFERLFANMVFQNMKEWGSTKYKYFYTAHYHHKEVKAKLWQGGPNEVKLPKGQVLLTEDLNGVLFDRLSSLTSNDYYEHSRGMIHIKGTEMFEFDKELGKTCTLSYQLPLSINKK